MSAFPSTTAFVNILVFVKPSDNPERKFEVTTVPPAPTITQIDTIVNYQIFDASGYDIVFTGIKVDPEQNDQLSVPTISLSGKTLTISDANTVEMDLSVYLQFQDKNNPLVVFAHDPQIINNPPT